MGIQRWDYEDERMHPSSDGDYVRFAHYEAEVAKLRAELAAKSKDAEALHGSLEFIANNFDIHGFKTNGEWKELAERMSDFAKEAMGEGNGR